MPDLKTDLMTLEEFQAAIEGKTGTVFIFDITGQGKDTLETAKATGVYQTGDWYLVMVADHCREIVLDDEILARVGGDKFALFTEADAQRVADWQDQIAACDVPLHWGKGQTIIEADSDMIQRRWPAEAPSFSR